MKTYLKYTDLEARRIVTNRVTLHRWIKAGRFPKPVRLGENSIAWIEAEIDAWQAAREAERDSEAA